MAARRERPSQRFLFDELLPWRVARALHELGFNTSHVGHEGHGAPSRGSSDATVLRHAVETNQVVVTSNHDMIILCAEQGQSVVWLDPRGRQLRHDETVVLAFSGLAEWARLLQAADGSSCVRVLRTKAEVLTLGRASLLAKRRMRSLRARRARPPRPGQQVDGQLAAGT